MLNVVITGCSSSIDHALVVRFASQGHRVLATSLRSDSSISAIKMLYPRVASCQLDQGDAENIEAFAATVKSWLSLNEYSCNRLHVLVNNAALGSAMVQQYVDILLRGRTVTPARRRALESEALMRVNALGPLWVTEALQGHMTLHSTDVALGSQRSYSTVMFMGSVGGSPGDFPECRLANLMANAAVAYLAKQRAAEQISSCLDVLCVSLGTTAREVFYWSTRHKYADPASLAPSLPTQRLLRPEEVANALYALCTEQWARAFHGGVLDASLGLSLRPGMQIDVGPVCKPENMQCAHAIADCSMCKNAAKQARSQIDVPL